MAETNQNYDVLGTSSREDDIDVPPEMIEKLLRRVPDGPLKHVEDVNFPDPWTNISIPIQHKRTKGRPGPKSKEDWSSEVRRVWRYIEDEKKLSESWLASLPPVQKLADLKYGGATIGKGIALKEILERALVEARKHQTDEKTQEMLIEYPRLNITTIAAKFGLSREHFSRYYVIRATNILVVTLRRVLDRSV